MVYGGGHWGTVYTATPQKKIKNTASPQKNVAKHRYRNLKFCPTINLFQISLQLGDGGSRSWLVIGRE